MLARGTMQLVTDIISHILFRLALLVGPEPGHQTGGHGMSVPGPAL